MNAIEVSHLTFSYDEENIQLKDVSFNVQKGEFVSIVGHNGSGKSTLAKLLIGLLTPKSGTILINGKELNEKTASEIRTEMGLVFQNPDNQFIGATVEDDIAFGLENHCVPSSEMQGIIENYASKVGMIDFLKKEPSNLSGGQKQRVAIAGALALSPKILIFDESTSMLDPKGKLDILNLIKDVKRVNPDLTILTITHDIEEAFGSDRVIVFAKGEIAADGKPSDVFKNDELLKSLHLGKPFVLEMKDKLNLVNENDDIDSLLEEICQSK